MFAQINVTVVRPSYLVPVFGVELNASDFNDDILICFQLIVNAKVNFILYFILL